MLYKILFGHKDTRNTISTWQIACKFLAPAILLFVEVSSWIWSCRHLFSAYLSYFIQCMSLFSPSNGTALAGGAVMVSNGTKINVMQSTFSQNNATNGGALYFEVAWPSVLLTYYSSPDSQLIVCHLWQGEFVLFKGCFVSGGMAALPNRSLEGFSGLFYHSVCNCTSTIRGVVCYRVQKCAQLHTIARNLSLHMYPHLQGGQLRGQKSHLFSCSTDACKA